jgi:hypothetical protein
MKKIYLKPETMTEAIQMEKVCALTMSGTTNAQKNATVLGRERGSRSESDDFDELW